MKAATVHQLKQELKNLNQEELVETVLRLSKFKKENKELLTYLLYDSENEAEYINSIKDLVEEQLKQINTSSYYLMKKSIRKILRTIKKYIRYSDHKTTELELLLYFIEKMLSLKPDVRKNRVLHNLLLRQLTAAEKAYSVLHEDLQYDYQEDLEKTRDLLAV